MSTATTAAPEARTDLPSNLRANPRLSKWLRLRGDGVVEARSGKVEIGQGILTALAQIVADELDVEPARVVMMRMSTAESPNEGMTSGSLSMQDSGKALRYACAEARALYLNAAAERLGVPAPSLHVVDGDIVAADGRRTSYWAFAEAGLLERDATASAAPKAASDRKLTGENAPRIDLPGKVFGTARYVHDLDLPGMLHGRALRPPSPAAKLMSLDDGGTQAMKGVVSVVRDGRFVGVIAEREEIAVKAIERLRKDSQWEESESLPDPSRLADWLVSQPAETTVIDDTHADVKVEARKRARFTRPYTAHASIGPSCAVAQWTGEALHVWSHAQGPFNQRADLAIAFGLAPEQVVFEHREGAGCYGHNGADDVAMDAALLARAAKGRPVKVVWSREDELSWAPFGPAMVVDIDAGVDASGRIVEWIADVYSNGHSSRPGRAKTPALLAASHRAEGAAIPLAINTPLATGGGAERNSIPAYDIAARRIRNHRLTTMPIRTSALRALGAFINVYAIESIVDEVARERGEDPVAWRLKHLAPDPRARAIVEAAARLASWNARKRREGVGYGFGYARYKHTGAYCAVAAEVEAGREIRVRNIWVAVDVGLAVNPGGVANQIEGGAIQAASWTLKEAVQFDRTRITSGAWERYPILKFSEVPAVQVQVLQQPNEPSVGAGEAPMGPTAAAIGNAVFDALGVRVRDLPITPERIVAAIG